MALLTPANLSTLQRPDYLAVPYRTPCCNLAHVCSAGRNSVVSYVPKSQNYITMVPYQHKSSRKLVKVKVDEERALINGSSLDTLIKDHADAGSYVDAVKIYINVLKSGSCLSMMHNVRSFSILVKAVGELNNIALGWQIYGHLLKLGGLDDIYVANSFLSMLWKCGEADDAVWMFDQMCERDSVTWSTMISGLYRSMQYYDALEVLSGMAGEPGVFPNRIACMSALSSCAMIRSIRYGREIHALLLKVGLDADDFVVSSLLDMYMKCGDVVRAEFVFEKIAEDDKQNTIFWNVMTSGYVTNDCYDRASLLFAKMMLSGVKIDSSTMVAILVLCSQSSDLALGRQVHSYIVKAELDKDIRVRTALVDMYFNCSDDESGLKSFGSRRDLNLIMWGTIISNLVKSNRPKEAMEQYRECRIDQNIVDSVILLGALRACSALKYKHQGKEIHGTATKLGLDVDAHLGGALVDMYMECHDIVSAQSIFMRLKTRDVVTWNALLSGYVQNNYVDEALKTFLEMRTLEIKPNAVTISCILSLCSRISTLSSCKEIHGYIIRQGFKTNVLLGNSLLAGYAKCGDMKSSLTFFERMECRDQVSWNSIIQGLGTHGDYDEAVQRFHKMKECGLKPDHMTYTSILSACSHVGKLDDGLRYFKSMAEEYELEPRIQQYTCMVDLLGRAGCLYQAYEMIMTMPCSPDDRIWGSLLASCRVHNNEGMARLVSDQIFKLQPGNSTGYHVLLANIYEDVGNWKDAARTRSNVKEMGLQKTPGCSWIEVENQIHAFTASDQSHNRFEEIYDTLETLTLEMKQSGYIPLLSSIMEYSGSE